MEPFDVVIRGGTIVRPREEPFEADLGIRNGRIAAIIGSDCEAPAESVVKAHGLHIFPGVVDPHAHIGLGGGLDEYRPDTGAASLGGVTTVFYILMHGGSYVELVKKHHEVASSQSHIDFAFHITLMTDDHLSQLDDLRDGFGIDSYKYFMSFRGDEGAYLGVSGTDDGAMYKIMTAVAKRDAVLMIHPENIEIVWRLREEVRSSGADGLRAWNASRPPFTEAEAVQRAAYLADAAGCDLYFVHLSCAAALEELNQARRRFSRVRFYGETCPHFLTHDEDSDVGSIGKVNPPLRLTSDREAVWQSLIDGSLDTVGSDHVGRGQEGKKGSIWDASAGFPGLPTLMPVLLSEGYHKRGMPLQRIAEHTSKRPAEIFGRSSRKGDIAIGMDADLALVDLEWERSPDAQWLGTYSDYTLYEGWSLKGWPRYTMVRGQLVQADGEVIGSPGLGEYVPRFPG